MRKKKKSSYLQYISLPMESVGKNNFLEYIQCFEKKPHYFCR